VPKLLWPTYTAVILALSGCDRVAFDHSLEPRGRDAGAHPGVDAGAHPGGDCRAADEGSPCDDRDICTPRSVCRSGACFGENPFEDCVVADTVDDFTDEQGGNGWWYGYWDAANDPDGRYDPASDFKEMEYCRLNTWLPAGRCDADPEWTQNLSHGLQHAETNPVLELPVRRWVSDVSGPATLMLEHHCGGRSGDGTRALLLLNGAEIWQNVALAGATAVEATLQVELEQGSLIEQLIHPRQSQDEDMSYFSIIVRP
jgi:hypothetical protein